MRSISPKEHLSLNPPLVEAGHVEDLIQAGQTVSTIPSPLDNSLAVYITPLQLQEHAASEDTLEQPVYFASFDDPPSYERRLFISDTYVIFSAFQNLFKDKANDSSISSPEISTIMRKLGIDYVNFIKECWVHTSQLPDQHDLQFSSNHYRELYSCFSLFVVLYLPDPGYEDAPVGEELMEWLNVHFIEPSTEEGDELSAMEDPWVNENFWPYLTRTTLRGLTKATVFFLNTLLRHSSEDLQALVPSMTALIDGQPRLQHFSAERDFAHAFRRWRDRVKALRIEMDRIPEDERSDDSGNWWDSLSDIIGILEGRSEVILRVCQALDADWKEVCAAWGVFVDPRVRRTDLPDIVGSILDEMPPSPTSMEDMVHSALFSGQPEQALIHASRLDRWLSAHFADFMDPLSLIDGDPDINEELSLRDQHVLSYAEYLHSDPNLWRITVSYMYSCSDIGRERADEVLTRVPLRLHGQRNASVLGPEGGLVGTLKEINEICRDYKREAVRRSVCRVAAQSCIHEKTYGLAVAYYTTAEDWPGLGRVADRVLNEYTEDGPDAFVRYASDVAPCLEDLQTKGTPHSVFIHRLVFVVRYSRLLQLRTEGKVQDVASDLVSIFRDNVAPRSWWAVLLCDSTELLQPSPTLLFSAQDAIELLQKVEEIFLRSSQGSANEYLYVLKRTLPGGGHKEALERLKVVRLALARYFARWSIMGSS